MSRDRWLPSQSNQVGRVFHPPNVQDDRTESTIPTQTESTPVDLEASEPLANSLLWVVYGSR